MTTLKKLIEIKWKTTTQIKLIKGSVENINTNKAYKKFSGKQQNK